MVLVEDFQTADSFVARAESPDFGGSCALFATLVSSVVDAEQPPLHGVFYYLNRPIAPNNGSWGQDSELLERIVPCASP